MKTSIDGTVYDAYIQAKDARFGQDPRPGGLYDLEAGGLRVVTQDPIKHAYTFASAGTPGRGCQEAHVESPCFVPRVKQLAIEQLLRRRTRSRAR